MDKAIRGTDKKKQIRFFAVDTTETVRHACEMHGLSITARVLFGRVISATVMLGIDLKGETDSVTLRVDGDGPLGGALAIAGKNGNVKGYVHHPKVETSPTRRGINVAGAIGNGMLRVIRDIGMERSYSGEVELISGEIGDDLAYFFLQSEQVRTAVGVGVLLDSDGSVRRAGGFTVQLMPDAEEETIAQLEENLNRFPNFTDVLDMGIDVQQIISNHILSGLDPLFMDSVSVQYHCGCDREKYLNAIRMLDRKELDEMIEKNEPVIVQCHFCNKEYKFSPQEIIDTL